MAFGNFYGGYMPQMYTPTGAMPDMLAQYRAQQTAQPAQQGGGLIWVQGEAGAKSFLVAPGQSVLLMDSENARFYLKSADNSGMPQPLRVFEYSECNAHASAPAPAQAAAFDPAHYVTREEFEALSEKLDALQANRMPVKAIKAKEDKTDE